MLRSKSKYNLLKKPAALSVTAFFLSLTVFGSVCGHSASKFIEASAALDKTVANGEAFARSQGHEKELPPPPKNPSPLGMIEEGMEDVVDALTTTTDTITVKKTEDSGINKLESYSIKVETVADKSSYVSDKSETKEDSASKAEKKSTVLSQTVTAKNNSNTEAESDTSSSSDLAVDVVSANQNGRAIDVLFDIIGRMLGDNRDSAWNSRPPQEKSAHVIPLKKGQQIISPSSMPAVPVDPSPANSQNGRPARIVSFDDEEIHSIIQKSPEEERIVRRKAARRSDAARKSPSISSPVAPVLQEDKSRTAIFNSPKEKENPISSEDKHSSISMFKGMVHELATQLGLAVEDVEEFLFGKPKISNKQEAEAALKSDKNSASVSSHARAGGNVQQNSQAVASSSAKPSEQRAAGPAAGTAPRAESRPVIESRQAAAPACEPAEKSWFEEFQEMLLKNAQKEADRKAAKAALASGRK